MEATNVFGRKLRELRYRRGYSLQKLADRLTGVREAAEEDLRGVNKSYISDLERGTKPPPSRKQIHRLARALRCTDDECNELYLAAGFLPPNVSQAVPLAELMGALGKIGEVANPSAVTAPHFGTVAGGPLPSRPVDDASVLPQHDFTVCLAGNVGKGLFQEGDILLVRATNDVPNGTPVVCKVGNDTLVRQYEKRGRTVTLNPPDELYEDVPAGRVKVLGQVVGFVRRV